MKKTLPLLSIIIGLLIFTGCGNQEDKTADQQVDQQNIKEIISPTQNNSDEEALVEILNEEQIQKEYEMYKDIIDQEEISLQDCDNFTDATIKKTCIDDAITTNALNNLDENICEQLANQIDVDDCKTKVIQLKENLDQQPYFIQDS